MTLNALSRALRLECGVTRAVLSGFTVMVRSIWDNAGRLAKITSPGIFNGF
jgi:hypothetical protein